MHLSQNVRRRRLLLISSLVINVGLLAYFKYANFFVENFNHFLWKLDIESVRWTSIVLPIGISFFTFQSLTYSLDVYRKVHEPLKKATDYILYIIMFPQLIAGPIVRFNSIADQITNRQESSHDRLLGFYRFCIGLGKKVLVANVLGAQADIFMSVDPQTISSTEAWIGIAAYTFQIYFDFSGYSDMAIGIGRMIGFKFPENFNNPYVAKSITEFWQRWHITLGAWMRDYLYIPLGGNRVKTKRRLYFNLWFVFLVSGLWHGASWNFVIWGAFHGFFLVVERLFFSNLLKKAGATVSLVYTFFITMMGWVIFRIEDFGMAMGYYKRLFSFDFAPLENSVSKEVFLFLIIATFFSFFTLVPAGKRINDNIFHSDYKGRFIYIMLIISALLFVLSVASVTTSNFNPFIYFRF